MYWNLIIRPKHRRSNKVDICVTAFNAEDEESVKDLFYKRHVGLEIITTSAHPTRELAYKQIAMMGSAVKSCFDFHEASMMCRQCGLNPIGSMSNDHLCDFCHMENEYERNYPNSPRV